MQGMNALFNANIVVQLPHSCCAPYCCDIVNCEGGQLLSVIV